MDTKNILTIIQARSSSTRLPEKVLLPIQGKPLLIRMVERVMASQLKGKVIVATSNESDDDIIKRLCLDENIDCFRGSKYDLLERHYKAARFYNADVVIKIPSDCPLIDPGVIDKVIALYFENQGKYDYVSNLHPSTYPDGNDVEVMSINALKTAYYNATRSFEREHTTPYIWENPSLFSIGNVIWDTGLDYSMTHRFTVDYPLDYLFVKTVYDDLYPTNKMFSLNDIIKYLSKHPMIMNLNQKYAGVNWYRHHIEELKTIKPSETKFI